MEQNSTPVALGSNAGFGAWVPTGERLPSHNATAEQWERASHALDADAEIDAMRRGT